MIVSEKKKRKATKVEVEGREGTQRYTQHMTDKLQSKLQTCPHGLTTQPELGEEDTEMALTAYLH